MLTNIKKRNEGFTIIEVLIVLAIAGLILLIVFLAVPALQRNARNTSRKNDVSAILAGVNEFEDNNNGTLPAVANAWTNTGGTLTITAPANGASATVKVGYYNGGVGSASGDVDLVGNGTAVAAGTFTSAANDYVEIAPGTVCSGSASVAGSARSVTAIYEIETGPNAYSQQCQGS